VTEVVNINDVLDGHVVLDIECLDRVYLNGYVPKLQVGGRSPLATRPLSSNGAGSYGKASSFVDRPVGVWQPEAGGRF
jgi:hypothetical protein